MNETSFSASSAVRPFAARVVRGAALVLSIASLLITAVPAIAAPFTFQTTGSLVTGRVDATMTLLPNGKVLVAGGAASQAGNPIASAELYDPASGTWTATGSMTTTRYRATATLLRNGKVLVVGGAGGGPPATYLNSAELYDPTTGTWSATGGLANS